MKNYLKFIIPLLIVFTIDQYIKYIFVSGYRLNGDCISLILVYNKGVAFSMFAFLGPYMKWLQGALVLGLFLIILKENYLQRYAFPAGLLMGGALGNIYDRFHHIGVVDYVAWHCGFHFAVFNYADVMIDLAFVIIIFMVYLFPEKSTR